MSRADTADRPPELAGVSGGHTSKPMRKTTNRHDETRGKAAKHPTPAKFGGVGQ